MDEYLDYRRLSKVLTVLRERILTAAFGRGVYDATALMLPMNASATVCWQNGRSTIVCADW